MSFIEAIVVIDHNPRAMPASVDDLAIVGGLSILLQFQMLGGFELIEVYGLGARDILFELLDEVLIG